MMMAFAYVPKAAAAGDTGGSSAGEIQISSENFEDEVFRAYVKTTFDTDHNESLDQEEISKIRRINLGTSLNNSLKISSLKGIEYFTNLQYLDCMYHILRTIRI